MVLKKTSRPNKLVYIAIYGLLINSFFGQTNNIDNPDVGIKQLEDLYILKIISKEHTTFNLSGQVVFDKDQFGKNNRVISFPSFKILF